MVSDVATIIFFASLLFFIIFCILLTLMLFFTYIVIYKNPRLRKENNFAISVFAITALIIYAFVEYAGINFLLTGFKNGFYEQSLALVFVVINIMLVLGIWIGNKIQEKEVLETEMIIDCWGKNSFVDGDRKLIFCEKSAWKQPYEQLNKVIILTFAIGTILFILSIATQYLKI